MPDRRRLAAGLGPALVGVLLGVAVGAVWVALAPTPAVRVAGPVLVSEERPEFEAAQDLTFALVAALTGLLHGAALLLRGTPRLPAAVGALLGAAIGAVVAWRLGSWLGPPPVPAQQQAGDGTLLAPLDLRALGVLALWPAVLASVLFAGLLSGGLASDPSAGDRRDDGLGEPGQVRGRELDVEAPPAGADEHGR